MGIEVFMLTFLSVFALVGIVYTILYLISLQKSRIPDKGIKLILYLPQNSSSKLEGMVRQLYHERITDKLMTDGKLYVLLSPQDYEAIDIFNKLKRMYPIEMLPEQAYYCMITKREIVND